MKLKCMIIYMNLILEKRNTCGELSRVFVVDDGNQCYVE